MKTPIKEWYEETFCEWVLEFSDGVIATIYDKTYDPSDIPTKKINADKVFRFHIGGKSPAVLKYVDDVFERRVTYTWKDVARRMAKAFHKNQNKEDKNARQI